MQSAAPEAALHHPFSDLPDSGTRFEVAPGIFWLRMPLPFALDHINLWLLADGDGWTMVDTGLNTSGIREAWEQILGGLTGPVKRIVVTHFHPDHFGLANWLQQKTGAPVWITQAEFLAGHAVLHQMPGYDLEAMVGSFRHNGLDEERCQAFFTRGNSYERGVGTLPLHYRRLIDGDALPVDGRNWKIIAGYGHSPEHAALWCEEADVLISGDMVLPRITTNVGSFAAEDRGNPLGRYLDSLSRFADLGDPLVLPSHGRPFRGLATRLTQLRQHHAERLEETLAACGEARSAAELMPVLFPRELDTHQVMFAMGETLAHLHYLEHAGKIRRNDYGGIARFRITAR